MRCDEIFDDVIFGQEGEFDEKMIYFSGEGVAKVDENFIRAIITEKVL